MLNFPNIRNFNIGDPNNSLRGRRSYSFSSLPEQSLQSDVLELSSSSLKSLEQAAALEELSGNFQAATEKYTSLLKNKLSKYGENSLEAAEVRLKLVHTLLKTGNKDLADYQIERLKHSQSQSVSSSTKKAIKPMLVAAEEAKKQAYQSWFKALEIKLNTKKNILSAIEHKEQAQKDAKLQALQSRQQELKLQERQTQKQKYADLVDDLKSLKINEVGNLGFTSDIQLQKDYDEEDAEILLKFNHGEEINLTSLPDNIEQVFSGTIQKMLQKTPKNFEVTPASSGSPVKINETTDLLFSPKAFQHLVATKALIQWKQASSVEEKEAWETQIDNWFSETPEGLEERYPSDKSLYDLFMDSEQNKGLGSLAGMQDLKNYFLTSVISPLFDADNTQGYKGLILHGEPGNGKTALSIALARHTGFNLYHIRRGNLETTYQNGVAETIAKTLKHARENKPSMVILEEVDSLAGSRDGAFNSGGSDEKQTTTIMGAIDELIEKNSPVILLATTNYLNKLDRGFRRAGRFHDEIEIHNPDQELREHLFKTYLNKFKNSESLAKKAAEISEGLTSAAIRTICEFDIANDTKIQSRFRKINTEPTKQDLNFQKLKEFIDERKKYSTVS